MKEIDIYDFDKTIVPFDSGSMFWGYCLIHYPWIAVLLPLQMIAGALALVGLLDFRQFKKVCFLFVALIPLDRAVRSFWDRHEREVNSFFSDRERFSVVISASPDFLLEEIDRRLGFDMLICSVHNRKTGAIIGKNCRDGEKVERLSKALNLEEVRVVNVFSDSLTHDRPIFSLGENCYHVVNGKPEKFNFTEVYH